MQEGLTTDTNTIDQLLNTIELQENLYNDLKDKNEFIDTVKYVDDGFTLWFAEVESYDYKKFDVDWLKRCSVKFYNDISNNSLFYRLLFFDI